ncbi:hypothetical protein VTN00DRAFT_7613 [Thermoascus crustaceus]|uniref:uncharacterized protein n=1 Tax=Thermoascus crustaceus TaxID=5088 RepID=UPI003742AB36
MPMPSSCPPCAIRFVLRPSPRSPYPAPFVRHQTYVSTSSRSLAQPRNGLLDELWFASSSATLFSPAGAARYLNGLNEGANGDHKPPDERILKLGKTLRTLSPLLPTILISPLPQEIVSPNVTLHLFPSTHPHLPTAKGRVLYRAALWTVPVAWSSVPLVGNVKLQIMSERIVRAGSVLDSDIGGESDCGDERLVVRWKTEPRGETGSESSLPSSGQVSSSASPGHLSASSKNGTNKGLSVLLGGEAPIFKLSKEEQFSGLFIFSFDEEGRISSHTIEHADQANGWDRTAKFVTLTDWLLGKARGSMDPSAGPGLAMQGCEEFSIDQDRRGTGSPGRKPGAASRHF